MKKKIFTLLALILAAVFINSGRGKAGSILVIADTHLTKEAQEHDDMMRAVIRAAQGKDAVLLLGDNTNNTHPEEHALVLRWAEEIRQQAGAEVYMIPGNHDYTSGYGPEEFSAQYLAYGRDRSFSRDAASASYAVMAEDGTCLLMLDTNQYTQAYSMPPYGGIGGRTLNWIQEALGSLPEGTPVLACGHHPILPRERDERTPGAYALGVILRAYGIGLYLCGHDHGFATLEQEGLRQVVAGQPQSYPGWAGVVEQEGGTFRWRTEQLYDEQSPFFIRIRENARHLGREMARGTLVSTPYAGDEDAVEWFTSAFMLFSGNEMTPEKNAELLADENCRKWREAEPCTVVKDWILSLLENPPEDVREIDIPASRVHPFRH